MKVDINIKWPHDSWEPRIAGVYILVFEGIGVYVGSSCHLKRRLGVWQGQLQGKYKVNFAKGIKEIIGKVENVSAELLEIVGGIDELKEREQFYIDHYSSMGLLINQSPKTKNNKGYRRSAQDLSYPPQQIYSIAKDGTQKMYLSIHEAAVELNIRRNGIVKSLKRERLTYKGLQFRYSNESENKYVYNRSTKHKRSRKTKNHIINILDGHGNFIISFKTIKEVATFIGKSKRCIDRVLIGEQKTVGGYKLEMKLSG